MYKFRVYLNHNNKLFVYDKINKVYVNSEGKIVMDPCFMDSMDEVDDARSKYGDPKSEKTNLDLQVSYVDGMYVVRKCVDSKFSYMCKDGNVKSNFTYEDILKFKSFYDARIEMDKFMNTESKFIVFKTYGKYYIGDPVNEKFLSKDGTIKNIYHEDYFDSKEEAEQFLLRRTNMKIGDYDVTIQSNTEVKVGCTTVSLEQAEELVRRMKAYNGFPFPIGTSGSTFIEKMIDKTGYDFMDVRCSGKYKGRGFCLAEEDMKVVKDEFGVSVLIWKKDEIKQ